MLKKHDVEERSSNLIKLVVSTIDMLQERINILGQKIDFVEHRENKYLTSEDLTTELYNRGVVTEND